MRHVMQGFATVKQLGVHQGTCRVELEIGHKVHGEAQGKLELDLPTGAAQQFKIGQGMSIMIDIYDQYENIETRTKEAGGAGSIDKTLAR